MTEPLITTAAPAPEPPAPAHLLAGFDGSGASVRALRWAAGEAVRRGAALEVVACFTAPPTVGMWPVPLDLDGLRVEIAADLARAVDALREEFPTLAVDGQVKLGRAGEELVNESKAAQVVAVGTSGAGAVEAFLLGSVAHHVARHAACPVVLVPDRLPPITPSGLVVAGVDGSDASLTALDWAVEAADRRGAELVVVHAWRDRYGDAIDDDEAHDLRRVDGAIDLDIALERARAVAGGAVRGVLLEARAADAILDVSRHADLVVVGSRGRGRMRSTLFGSVAHAVAARATCPVAVVRHPEEQR